MKFVWDDKKAESNCQKHGVSFTEAVASFKDRCALELFDASHSKHEDRWMRIGSSSKLRSVLCVYTIEQDGAVRIISARLATKNEAQIYHERMVRIV